MPVRLSKWGHSKSAIRIPHTIAESAGLEVGSLLDVRLLDSGEIRLKPVGKTNALEDSAAKVIHDTAKVEVW
jgi:antitoxin component of MazEF toxin-antitoxin module